MFTVTYAQILNGKLLIDFEADGQWRLNPGDILKSGDITIRFLQMGMNHIPNGRTIHSFLGESVSLPEALIGKTYDILQG